MTSADIQSIECFPYSQLGNGNVPGLPSYINVILFQQSQAKLPTDKIVFLQYHGKFEEKNLIQWDGLH